MRLPIPPPRHVTTQLIITNGMDVVKQVMEAAPGFEPGVKDLQSSALPLGYAAIKAVIMERKTGFEPATLALARRYSTTEPLPHTWLGRQGSNLRMTESKSVALPLGYSPTRC